MMRQTEQEIKKINEEKIEIENKINALKIEREKEKRTLNNLSIQDYWFALRDEPYIKNIQNQLGALLKEAGENLNYQILQELNVVEPVVAVYEQIKDLESELAQMSSPIDQQKAYRMQKHHRPNI